MSGGKQAISMSSNRRPIHFNPEAATWVAAQSDETGLAQKFHQKLPGYAATPLISLVDIAEEIGVKAIHFKDESRRFGLPSFKILGASWGTFRAITSRLHLSTQSPIGQVRAAAMAAGLKLYAATDGNHGRAMAWMGSLIGLPVEIHIPVHLDQSTSDLIANEGAQVVRSTRDYDQSMSEASTAAKGDANGLLVQDCAFDGYEDIPQWIVEGYRTMLMEVDAHLDAVDLVVCPVGVGSLAQAVVSHVKRPGRKTAVLATEPDTAACLWKSLKKGEWLSIETSPTIMSGLDCGTVSKTSWPVLRDGVDASLTVSDYESHMCSLELQSKGIHCGPCGASTLAALRRLTASDKVALGLTATSIVLLLGTEGSRDYPLPHDVAIDDPVALTQSLVKIDSASPGLGSIPGPGEVAIARYIKAWLEHRDIESHWIEPTPGRPSVIGIARGSGGGKDLMFNGHIDTVTLQGYEDDPLGGEIREGKLFGRGAADMKSGLAAAMVALARSKDSNSQLRGDVIFVGVADEEDTSIGTQQVLEAGWRADAALVNEPTGLDIIHKHKGFVWFEIDVHGVAYHGSRPDMGVDAICKAGLFLAQLDRYSKELLHGVSDPVANAPSVHASLIKGGEESSSYPALCTIVVEYRTVGGQTTDSVKKEMQSLIDQVSRDDSNFRADLRVLLERSPFLTEKDGPLGTLVRRQVGQALGRDPTFRGVAFWTDAALLADAGIPTVLWGPNGDGMHAKEEWVEVESITIVADALTAIAAEFCS